MTLLLKVVIGQTSCVDLKNVENKSLGIQVNGSPNSTAKSIHTFKNNKFFTYMLSFPVEYFCSFNTIVQYAH